MLFTETLAAELDYTWQNNNTNSYDKSLSAPMNTPVSFRMAGNTGSALAMPPSGCTTDWYGAATGGTPILSGNNTLTRTAMTSTTTYYAQSRNTSTGCVSSARTAVTITVSPCVIPVNPHLRSYVY
jgi:hypothetical protein